jgi:transposase
MRERDHDTVLHAARARQQTETCHKVSARGAGIDGTMAQGTRLDGRRRSRAIGLVQTRLRPRLVAAARNLRRVAAWLAAIPRAQTRSSAFAALAA